MAGHFRERFIERPHPAVSIIILAISVAVLWQASRTAGMPDRTDTQGTLLRGEVVKVVSEQDAPGGAGSRTDRVQDVLIRLQEGRDVMVYNDLVPLEPGDDVFLTVSLYGTADESFSILDYRRAPGLAWLVALFAALVIGISRRKGVEALAGMAFAGAVIFGYTVPALLRGAEPFMTGLVSAGVILVGTFYVSYGFNRKSLSALAGIAVTLLVTGALGRWVVGALKFTGYGDDAAIYLRAQTDGAVDLVGLIIAGIIIAAIGVLDDVAVTQSSTVMELAHAGTARGWALFRQAMRVGSDHISAVVNTLLLAYAGASLPLILLLRSSNFPIGFSVGGEQVAEEVVRTMVSSIGLVLAVPLTTLLAVAVVNRWGPGNPDHHPHHHA